MSTELLPWVLAFWAVLFLVYRAEVWLHRRDLVREVARHPETRCLRRLEMQR